MVGDEDVLVPLIGGDGKPARQVGGCPLGAVQRADLCVGGIWRGGKTDRP